MGEAAVVKVSSVRLPTVPRTEATMYNMVAVALSPPPPVLNNYASPVSHTVHTALTTCMDL